MSADRPASRPPSPADRLAAPFGRLIDRDQPLAFRFAGRAYSGLAGDTVASALIANGVWALGASLQGRRPRGVHALGEPGAEAWVTLPDRPHAAADTLALSNGMAISPGEPARGGRPALPAGGRRPAAATHVATQVAIVGGGPAGIAAAIAAADAGREVVLIERLPLLGGGLLHGRLDREGRAAALRRDALVAALDQRAGVQVWTGATCFGLDPGLEQGRRRLQVWHGGRRIVLSAAGVVLATGSVGQRMVFRDNDLPGVIQARTAEQLVHLYGVRPGARAVVASADGVGLGTALTLLDAGIEVPAVLDILDDPVDEPLRRAISARGVPVFRGHTVVAGLPTEGGTRLGAVVAAPSAGPDRFDSAALRIMCEVLCISSGWHPALGLATQLGARLRYDAATHRLAVDAMPADILLAGSAAGVAEVAAAELDGLAAGAAAAGGNAAPVRRAARPNLDWPLVDDPMRRGRGSDYVYRAADLTRQDLGVLAREGLGMPADIGEGRTDPSEIATAHRLLAGPEGQPEARVAWMPPAPTLALTMGELAGPLALASRRSPLDALHRAAGAAMQGFESWMMPAAFPGGGAGAADAELRAVREHIGLMDRSDLGKVIVSGTGAAALLDRIATGRPGALPIGVARLTRPRGAAGEAIGAVVAARLGDEDFLLTTYPDRAGALVRLLRAAVLPDEGAVAVETTAAHAVLSVAGPNAATLLAALGAPAELLTEAALPFAVGATRIAGIATLILRTAGVGEPTYELFVAAGLAAELWRRLTAAGQRHGLHPVGRLAERLLRLETGHLDDPGECADLARLLPGQALVRVGFAVARGAHPAAGQPVLSADGGVIGRVLAFAWSPSLGHGIGIAIVARDAPRPGDRLLIAQPVGPAIVATASPEAFRKPPVRAMRVAAAAAEEEMPAPPRQSPLHDRLAAAGATFGLYGGGLVADSVPAEPAAGGPGLLDLSALPRMGLMGGEAGDGLRAMGLPLARGPAATICGGLIAAWVAPDEAVVLPDPLAAALSVPQLLAVAPEEACPGLLRGDLEAWFLLLGQGAANCLVALGCDPAALQAGRVVRCRLFGCETVLIPGPDGVHLLVEAALAETLWDGICGVLPGCGGRVAGLAEAAELL